MQTTRRKAAVRCQRPLNISWKAKKNVADFSTTFSQRFDRQLFAGGCCPWWRYSVHARVGNELTEMLVGVA